MKERFLASAMLVIACCSLAFAARMSPLATSGITDPQAQKRTIRDISIVGTAMFSWLTDQIGAAAAGQQQTPFVTLSFHTPISHAALEAQLVPTYLNDLPELDGWNYHYQYYLNVNNPLAQDVMAIRSIGRDNAEEASSYTVTAFDRDDFDQDIVWADGFYVRWPAQNQGVSFYALPPCRALDTRPGSALPSGVTRLIQLGGACGVPTSAESVTVNVTIAGPTGAGHVTLFPAGLPVPSTSTINFTTGQTRANNAVILLDTAGSIAAQASVAGGGQVHLILDIDGYFE